MIERRSAEQFLAELEDILRRFQSADAAGEVGSFTRDEALRRLRKLGFSAGEAHAPLAPRQAGGSLTNR